MVSDSSPPFNLFSSAHIGALMVITLLICLLFYAKKMEIGINKRNKRIERLFALSLVIMDIGYYLWILTSGRWDFSNSLPLELCSFSLLVIIILLWTGDKRLIDFVFFAGIGGAIQALATPVLDIGFPHFRFFHFFYTHGAIILTALYFVWMKDYRPTFKGVVRTMIALNILLPIIFFMNKLTAGNYMFLHKKPVNGSLLDYLGPYPWYILSLEFVTFTVFTLLWLLFRKKTAVF